MKKNRLIRILCVLLSALITITAPSCAPSRKKHQETYFTFFDTVTTVSFYSDGNADAFFDTVRNLLEQYHRLLDIYNSYEGTVNLKTLNDNAGKAVTVSAELLDFISFGKEAYRLTGGYTNIALGSVLSLWHTCRTEALEDPDNAAIPDPVMLEEASKHTDISDIIIDDGASSVRLADPLMSLDAGAVGKGYAAKIICERLNDEGYTDFLLNIGGNVSACGSKGGNEIWKVGVENPQDTSASLCTLSLTDLSLVTSGSYQRYYTVGDTDYNHIIDPDTLMPASFYLSVSVLCPAPAMADALSTGLFCMDIESGKELVASLEGTEAMWVLPDGSTVYSDGFQSHIAK